MRVIRDDHEWEDRIQRMYDEGMTQSDIAEYCNTTAATIQRLGIGEHQEPRYKLGSMLDRLETLCGIKVRAEREASNDG